MTEKIEDRCDCFSCKYDYAPNYRLCMSKYWNKKNTCFVLRTKNGEAEGL